LLGDSLIFEIQKKKTCERRKKRVAHVLRGAAPNEGRKRGLKKTLARETSPVMESASDFDVVKGRKKKRGKEDSPGEEELKPPDKEKTFFKKKKKSRWQTALKLPKAKRANNAKSNFCKCFLSSPAPIVIPIFKSITWNPGGFLIVAFCTTTLVGRAQRREREKNTPPPAKATDEGTDRNSPGA
jgi:hypothetical protein